MHCLVQGRMPCLGIGYLLVSASSFSSVVVMEPVHRVPSLTAWFPDSTGMLILAMTRTSTPR